jgi:two-component system sensor histidine kinase PilS (NtrC family)
MHTTAIDSHNNLKQPLPFDAVGLIDTKPTHTWKPLRFLNLYRLSLAGTTAVFSMTNMLPNPLGERDFELFFVVSVLYLAISIINIMTIKWRQPAFNTQVYTHVLIDISAITLLMHASGGVSSGLGMLLVVAIAGGSLLMAGRTAMLFAAIATIAVLIEHVYTMYEGDLLGTSYTQAGLLGASFFATAILAHVLAHRLRETEALAERRGVDLANMSQLTEYVIQRMQTGIVVVDTSGKIRLINESAYYLLGMPAAANGKELSITSPQLATQLQQWWQDTNYKPDIFRAADSAPEIIPRFARLGGDETAGALVFLEDTAAMAQQAQQLKLASLGRLTASIAHEIRNPLGAISHAGQLLAESHRLDAGDTRLTEIIQEHSQRVNTIIENIMQLSRRDHVHVKEFRLKSWLQGFIHDFSTSEQVADEQIDLIIEPEDTVIRFDPSQLHQIMWNLFSNGIHHGAKHGQPSLLVNGGVTHESRSPYLDIIDSGPGIDHETAQHIFDPFFTTESQGTGLGLYIARELCECNQARLNYISGTGVGCFRISFADPRRRQVI